MTHIVHPYAHRLGILRDWKSRWFSADPKKYREFIKCDISIRKYLQKRLRGFYVSDVEIERGEKKLRIIIKTSRPGLIIGRSGEGAVKLKNDIAKIISKHLPPDNSEIKLDIEEIRSPESNAAVVSQMVAEALEKRMTFRRVLKQTLEKVMANRDVLGARIAISGRLGGAEMSRKEQIKKGRIPLQTFRADIDFAREKAYLSYGVIGIKVWIYKGDIFSDSQKNNF
ncbi:30S ribosomal protein S3 [Candidatus Campbellbacteria bacterium CG10_big_fil_rev_8_21_14_0_10_35_52]|uniref:Small ribosomal subunit protein uS3 n=1 Tax=Candidatus Campbellbacteria bacterium CG10_big_fil_rev_8_21_14_0_10_35_52 TaxID=1974527 RepID=A0A2M6WVQ4_9BACT|nr:MAG: 30S ribosomal protein S3 [Candidatus Campbellbacteria bacterium CG10_big_fil_rev_8_21_14_0_10_35_52]